MAFLVEMFLWAPLYSSSYNSILLDRSPAILTSDDFIRSNEIVRTKWPIYQVIGHFVLTIYWYHQNVRKGGDRSTYFTFIHLMKEKWFCNEHLTFFFNGQSSEALEHLWADRNIIQNSEFWCQNWFAYSCICQTIFQHAFYCQQKKLLVLPEFHECVYRLEIHKIWCVLSCIGQSTNSTFSENLPVLVVDVIFWFPHNLCVICILDD